jgi:hypothetical protein
MTKKELEQRVAELERRIAFLESRPVLIHQHFVPYPQPVPLPTSIEPWTSPPWVVTCRSVS